MVSRLAGLPARALARRLDEASAWHGCRRQKPRWVNDFSFAGGRPVLKPHGVAEFDAGGRVLACRLTEDHLLLLALTPNMTILCDRLTALSQNVPLVQSDASSAYAMFCLLGTAIEDALNHLTALDVRRSAFPPGSCAETSLAGVHALLVRPAEAVINTVYVAVAWDLAEHVGESLLNAAPGHDTRPVGVDTWQILSGDSTASLS